MNQYYDKFNNILTALNQGKIDDKTLIKDANASQIKAKISELYQLTLSNFLDRKKIAILISMISDQKIAQALKQSVLNINNKWIALPRVEDIPSIETYFTNMDELERIFKIN